MAQFKKASSAFKDMCGPGVDGEIIRSVNGNEVSLFSESYTINTGITMTVTGGGVVIFAQKTITIAGTLSADSKGAPGGASGTYSSSGGVGASGLIGGSGGAGGESGAFHGGAGGVQTDLIKYFNHFLYFRIWEALTGSFVGGCGGGGGSGCSTNPSTGGLGGIGGGFIVLFSPIIRITGALSLKGEAGGDYILGPSSTGGGGGGGGFIWLIAGSIIDNGATYSLDGGACGSSNGTGVDGDPGNTGTIKKVIVG